MELTNNPGQLAASDAAAPERYRAHMSLHLHDEQRGAEPVANVQNIKNLVLPLGVDALVAFTIDTLFAAGISARSAGLIPFQLLVYLPTFPARTVADTLRLPPSNYTRLGHHD